MMLSTRIAPVVLVLVFSFSLFLQVQAFVHISQQQQQQQQRRRRQWHQGHQRKLRSQQQQQPDRRHRQKEEADTFFCLVLQQATNLESITTELPPGGQTKQWRCSIPFDSSSSSSSSSSRPFRWFRRSNTDTKTNNNDKNTNNKEQQSKDKNIEGTSNTRNKNFVQQLLQFDYLYDQVEINVVDIQQDKKNLIPTTTRTTPTTSTTSTSTTSTTTTGIILIHPIGVGIARWFYERLLNSLYARHDAASASAAASASIPSTRDQPTKQQRHKHKQRFIVVVPDLLGSGSATNPMLITTNQQSNATSTDNDGIYQSEPFFDVKTKRWSRLFRRRGRGRHRRRGRSSSLPLLNISDWSEQIVDLMAHVEQELNSTMVSSSSSSPSSSAPVPSPTTIDRWCLVANGGCSPIALQAAQKCFERRRQYEERDTTTTRTSSSCTVPDAPVTNIILSSVPRLPFFFPDMVTKTMTEKDESKSIEDDYNTKRREKVEKSYKTLCGIVGKLFWWYACRNDGQFIQTFSEKNLIANVTNLGPTWQSNCYQTASTMNDGKSKYSTFAFLAGTLQDGCVDSLNTLKRYGTNKNIKNVSTMTTTATATTTTTATTTNDGSGTIRIDILKGRDTRRNQARSWFWQSRKKARKKNDKAMTKSTTTAMTNSETKNITTKQRQRQDTEEEVEVVAERPRLTLRDYLTENGLGGKEITIGGRISLAHEDPNGYSDGIIQFLSSN